MFGFGGMALGLLTGVAFSVCLFSGGYFRALQFRKPRGSCVNCAEKLGVSGGFRELSKPW